MQSFIPWSKIRSHLGRTNIAQLAIWIQPGELFTAYWLLQFDVAYVEDLRPSSRESPFLHGSQCNRLRENRPQEPLFGPFFARSLPMESNPVSKTDGNQSGELIDKYLPVQPLIPPERWRLKHEVGRTIRRVSARTFDAAEPRAAKLVAERERERDLCETSVSAGDGAECKSRTDEMSADNTDCEVFAGTALFAAKKLAEQQPGWLFV